MLARECTAVFIDLDRYIVDNQKMTIPEIFAQKGEPYFRDLEAQYIRNFRGRTIVATGGGAILRDGRVCKEAGRCDFSQRRL